MDRVRNRLGWELDELMYLRRIRTFVELSKRLRSVGVEISAAHLSRIRHDPPERLSRELLEGLTTVLTCTMNDLMPVVSTDAKQESPPTPVQAPKPSAVPTRQEPKPSLRELKQKKLSQPLAVEQPAPKPAAGPLRVVWNGTDDDCPKAPAYPPPPVYTEDDDT